MSATRCTCVIRGRHPSEPPDAPLVVAVRDPWCPADAAHGPMPKVRRK